MQAAIELSKNGVSTSLIEKDEQLGGRAYRLSRTFRTQECKPDGCCMDYCRECVLTPKYGQLYTNENLEVLLETEVDNIIGEPGKYKVELNSKGEKKTLDVSAIVVATGS